ncbi:hypothetical protein JHK86_044762 [Glycine max]|nr:hypothetical protein JHK86_044762 [Glycine max]
MTQKKPNFQDLWQITHTRKGEWVDETSKEVHMRVEEVALEKLQGINKEADKDQIVNAVF